MRRSGDGKMGKRGNLTQRLGKSDPEWEGWRWWCSKASSYVELGKLNQMMCLDDYRNDWMRRKRGKSRGKWNLGILKRNLGIWWQSLTTLLQGGGLRPPPYPHPFKYAALHALEKTEMWYDKCSWSCGVEWQRFGWCKGDQRVIETWEIVWDEGQRCGLVMDSYATEHAEHDRCDQNCDLTIWRVCESLGSVEDQVSFDLVWSLVSDWLIEVRALS